MPVPVPAPGRALPRRAVLAAACGTCAAAVAGCTTYSPGGPAAAPPAAAPSAAPPAVSATGSPSGSASSGLTAVAGVPVDDLPVGGGTIFADRDLVVTRPSDTEVRAFSATCTHQGCAVTSVADGEIVCACHGSSFSVTDGRPLAGPATQPLAERNVTVRDGVVEIV